MTTPSIYNDPLILPSQNRSLPLRHQVNHVKSVQWMIRLIAPKANGAVAGLVIEVGVVSGVFNLESPGVEALGRRPRHEQCYHEA
jgi:hypothetical protein